MNSLIVNMVDNIQNIQNEVIHIDLILSGGAFNAIYLVGCLHFIREMERRNKIIIHRISSCSASSLVGLLYFTNNLELFETKLYDISVNSFKKNKKYIFSDEDIITVFNLIKKTLYEVNGLTEYEILIKVNYKLYITYFDIKKCKRIVKKKYKSLDDIFETIKKSVHIPFITMKCMLYQNRYMDGWQPFIFTNNKSNNSTSLETIKKKQLYIDLLGRDKVKHCIILKSKKKNKDKIMNGIFDAYSFFYEDGKNETAMCGYFNDYSITSLIKYYSIYIFSYILCIFLYLYVFLFHIPSYHNNIFPVYFIKKFLNFILEYIKNAFHYFFEHYCL